MLILQWVERVSKKSLKENRNKNATYIQNQKVKAGTSWTNKEERWHGEFATQR